MRVQCARQLHQCDPYPPQRTNDPACLCVCGREQLHALTYTRIYENRTPACILAEFMKSATNVLAITLYKLPSATTRTSTNTSSLWVCLYAEVLHNFYLVCTSMRCGPYLRSARACVYVNAHSCMRWIHALCRACIQMRLRFCCG